jgi:hypothetical protein
MSLRPPTSVSALVSVRSVRSRTSVRTAPLLRAVAVPAAAAALVAASCVQAHAATPVDGPLSAAVSALAGAAAVSGGFGGFGGFGGQGGTGPLDAPGGSTGPTAGSCQTRAEVSFGEQVCYSARPDVRVDITAALRGGSLGRCGLAGTATRCTLTGTADGWTADASYRVDFGAPSVSSTVRVCAPDGSCTDQHRVYRF